MPKLKPEGGGPLGGKSRERTPLMKWIVEESEKISVEEVEREMEKRGSPVKFGYLYGPGYLTYFRPEFIRNWGEFTVYTWEEPVEKPGLQVFRKRKELHPGVFVEYFRHFGDYWHFGRVLVKKGADYMLLSRAEIDRHRPTISEEKWNRELEALYGIRK